MHDSTVDRTTTGKGRVADLAFDLLRALGVATFDDALALAHKAGAQVYVDSKQLTPPALIAALDKHGMLDRVVVYGSVPFLEQVRQLNPSIRIMPEAVSLDNLNAILKKLRPNVIAFDDRDFQDAAIAAAKRAGADVYVDRLGPVDNPAGWQDAIDRGATGIQTDHPAELVQFLRSKQLHK
jgi:glycerophosphoryl diester phosphodiesterase